MTFKHTVVPQPVEVDPGEGCFELRPDTVVELPGRRDGALGLAAKHLVTRLRAATGFPLDQRDAAESAPMQGGSAQGSAMAGAGLAPTREGVRAGEKGNHGACARSSICLSLLGSADARLGAEGYTLHSAPDRVEIAANTANGLFYGAQTLLQLLPPEIEADHPVGRTDWSVPCVRITDYPRFAWRGLELDVSRHFFTKEEVLAYIDQMVRYKFNVFHIHLTDDQGWRLEIKGRPRLTEVGAWRVPRTGAWWSFDHPAPGEAATDGGFYSHEDVREIVRYAADRFVTILPEIDVPGHSLAALAAYPELSCTGGPFYVSCGDRFYSGDEFYNGAANTLCVGNDAVFDFLDGVMGEVADLFPGDYIHMGGDEATRVFWKACPRCQGRMAELGLESEDELQSYFVKRTEKIIESKGKRLLGWDEIIEGGISPNATVMSWRGMKGGIEAARMGHDVVMTPAPFYYLDLYQGDPVAEPQTYSMSRLKECYELDPVPEEVDPAHVLGGQGNLWTESVPDLRHAQYMTWPRGMAIAETLWSTREAKDWAAFAGRVEEQFARLDAAEVKYSRAMFDVIFRPGRDDRNRLIVELDTEVAGLDIHYTWAGTNPDRFHPRYQQPICPPPGAAELRVVTYRDGLQAGKEIVMPVVELEKRAPATEA